MLARRVGPMAGPASPFRGHLPRFPPASPGRSFPRNRYDPAPALPPGPRYSAMEPGNGAEYSALAGVAPRDG